MLGILSPPSSVRSATSTRQGPDLIVQLANELNIETGPAKASVHENTQTLYAGVKGGLNQGAAEISRRQDRRPGSPIRSVPP